MMMDESVVGGEEEADRAKEALTPATAATAKKTSEHLGLGLPEFVELLHLVAFHIYFSDEILDAAYPKDEDKVSRLYDRLLISDHAALRAVLVHLKVSPPGVTWPDSLQADDIVEYGDDVVSRSEELDAATVLSHLSDMASELQQASKTAPRSGGMGALRGGIRKFGRTASGGGRGGGGGDEKVKLDGQCQGGRQSRVRTHGLDRLIHDDHRQHARCARLGGWRGEVV